MELEQRLEVVKNVARKILKSYGVSESEYSADDAAHDLWIVDAKLKVLLAQRELSLAIELYSYESVMSDTETKATAEARAKRDKTKGKLRGAVISCHPALVAHQTRTGLIDIARVKFGRIFKDETKNIHKVGKSIRCDVSTCPETFYDNSEVMDSSLLTMENEELLKKCRKLLNSAEDEALFNRYYSGETFLQTAIRCGVSEATIHANYKKALYKIRDSSLIKDLK
jgi:hypothetical protein